MASQKVVNYCVGVYTLPALNYLVIAAYLRTPHSSKFGVSQTRLPARLVPQGHSKSSLISCGAYLTIFEVEVYTPQGGTEKSALPTRVLICLAIRNPTLHEQVINRG
jgi:hypothetical protein